LTRLFLIAKNAIGIHLPISMPKPSPSIAWLALLATVADTLLTFGVRRACVLAVSRHLHVRVPRRRQTNLTSPGSVRDK
jgi:hypothetical protein